MNHHEHEHQKALFEWAATVQRRHPELALMFAIPNAGGYTGGFKSNVRRVQAMKAEGVRSGVPDICLPVARGGFHGLFLEMKAGKGSETANQALWRTSLTEQGYFSVVCHGWEAAKRAIMDYLSGKA